MPTLTRKRACDYNDDGQVNTADLTAFLGSFGASFGQTAFKAECDFNNSGAVDTVDMTRFLGTFGQAAESFAGRVSNESGSIVGYNGYLWDDAAQMWLCRFRWLDPVAGRWINRDPAGYVDGGSLYEYVASAPPQWMDPFGLQTTTPNETQKEKQQTPGSQPASVPEPKQCKTDCNSPDLNKCQVLYCALVGGIPSLKPESRLGRAREQSGIDPYATMLAIAQKESKLDPAAKNKGSSASGMFQILDKTKGDIESRTWPRATGEEGPKSETHSDWRFDPYAAAPAAYLNILDRIASQKNNLDRGLGAAGTGVGTDYAAKIKAGIAAARRVCGVKGDRMTAAEFEECARTKCDELMNAMEGVVR